jgi:nucleolar protein 14
LVEWKNRGKVGGVVDRRIGENDPTMSLEDRMLERFAREKQVIADVPNTKYSLYY